MNALQLSMLINILYMKSAFECQQFLMDDFMEAAIDWIFTSQQIAETLLYDVIWRQKWCWPQVEPIYVTHLAPWHSFVKFI